MRKVLKLMSRRPLRQDVEVVNVIRYTLLDDDTLVRSELLTPEGEWREVQPMEELDPPTMVRDFQGNTIEFYTLDI
jgi:hypothetical protein